MQIALAPAPTMNVPELTRSVLERIAEALEFQQYAHVAPFWQGGGVKVSAFSSADSIPDDVNVCPMIVYGDPDEPGALGWHTYFKGKIYSALFLNPILANGGTLIEGPNSLSCTASHEACEEGLDPYVNDYSFTPEGKLEWKEACDRTEGDSYDIGGVSVSNFLGPRAFRDGDGPYDWLRLMNDPWEVRPGGYVQRLDPKTDAVETVWGPRMPAWKRELKELKSKMGFSRHGRRMSRLTAQKGK